MTQQQTLQLFLPILILLPVLYFRMRRMSKSQPLKLGRLWIRPAIILKIAKLDGTVLVLNQVRDAKGELAWAQPLAGWTDEKRAGEWCDKQVKFDPDLWIVEIEDREGRAFVDEPIL